LPIGQLSDVVSISSGWVKGQNKRRDEVSMNLDQLIKEETRIKETIKRE